MKTCKWLVISSLVALVLFAGLPFNSFAQTGRTTTQLPVSLALAAPGRPEAGVVGSDMTAVNTPGQRVYSAQSNAGRIHTRSKGIRGKPTPVRYGENRSVKITMSGGTYNQGRKPGSAATRHQGDGTTYSFYDAWTTLITDNDGDGYYSKFSVKFDVDDNDNSTRSVYAKIYMREGAGSYFLVFVTSDFDITGESRDDWQMLTANLNSGFPTDEYDIKIEIYESGGSTVVATRGPDDDEDLNNLHLEDATNDIAPGGTTYVVYDAWSYLVTDNDLDGYYQEFKIKFDVDDNDYSTQAIYAKLYIREGTGPYSLYYTTPDFSISGYSGDDWYEVTTTLNSGFPPDLYDIKIEIYESGGGVVKATRGPDNDTDLNDLKLEDATNDGNGNPDISVSPTSLTIDQPESQARFSRLKYLRRDTVVSPYERKLHVPPIKKSQIVSTFIDSKGKEVMKVIMPGKPPDGYRAPVARKTSTSITIPDVPAYDWSFGCTATSAAMIAGYYDRNGFPNIYTGPTNGGVMPMDNSSWGTVTISGEVRSQCPLSASRDGVDGRSGRGHVDDYWIQYGNDDPDPFMTNGWVEHLYGDCLADYMRTNQYNFGNSDGSTTLYIYNDGSPLSADFDGDGIYGMKRFFEARGYTVDEYYTQLIYGYNGNTQGFTFASYKQEIDEGKLVMLQVEGHTMLGCGYDDATSTIYLHDTWDYSTHSMTWGGDYYGMNQWGVSVIHISGGGTNVFAVSNVGTGILSVSDISDNKNWLTVSPSAPQDIESGMNRIFTVSVDWNQVQGSQDIGTVQIASNDADEPIVEVQVTANKTGVVPTITVSVSSLPDFGSVQIGASSPSKSYIVSGFDLSDDIHVNAPQEFQISSDNSAFYSTLTIPQSGGIVGSTPVYVKFVPANSGPQADVITQYSSGAADQVVSVSGAAVAQTVTYFQPIWSGTPNLPMSISVKGALIRGDSLDAGDEIGIFDNGVCVGAAELVSRMDSTRPLTIAASADQTGTPEKDGFTPGNKISYKVWRAAASKEITNVKATYSVGDGRFASEGDALVSLYKPALSGDTVQIDLPHLIASRGDTVKARVHVKFPPNTSFASMDLAVKGFQNKLNLLSIDTAGTMMGRNGWNYEYRNTDTLLVLASAGFQDISGEGTILNLDLEVPAGLSPATIPLDIAYASFDDGEVAVRAENGSITVSPFLAPVIIKPALGQGGLMTDIEFRWHHARNAENYDLQVARDSLFNASLFVEDSTITDTTKTFSGFAFNKKYWWRIRSQNHVEKSGWSPKLSFFTDIVRYGDVSLDDTVTSYDASFVLKSVVNLTTLDEQQRRCANVTCDSTISALDANIILRYIVGLVGELPYDTTSGDLHGSGTLDIASIPPVRGGLTVEIPILVSRPANLMSVEGVARFNTAYFDLSKVTLDGTFEYRVSGDSLFFAAALPDSENMIPDTIRIGSLTLKAKADVGNNKLVVEILRYRLNEEKLKSGPRVITDVRFAQRGIPTVYSLDQNFPNPFNPSTVISYGLPSVSDVTLKVYDVLGREVATLANGRQSAGYHTLTFGGARIPSGVYFYRLDAKGVNGKNFSSIKKMVFLK